MLLTERIKSTYLQLCWLLLLPLLCLFWGANSYYRSATVERIERYAFDNYSATLTQPRIVPEISIILAGEESINRLGRWPWPRKTHAELLGRLGSAHTVVLDILFPEESSPEQDQHLISAAEKVNNLVLGAHYYTESDEGKPQLKTAIDQLDRQAGATGFTNMSSDIDGLIRFMVPSVTIDGRVIPAFPLAAAASVLGQPLKTDTSTQEEIESFYQRTLTNPDTDNRIWLPLSQSSFPMYEYAKVVEGDIPPETFQGKVVIVGVSASGTEDFFSIPSPSGSREITGAELNALIMTTLLSGIAPNRASPEMDAAVTLFLVILGALLTRVARPSRSFMALVVVLICYVFLHKQLFVANRFWLAQALPLAGFFTTYFLFLFLRYKRQHQEMEVKTLSISYINSLPLVLSQGEDTFDSYLESIWPDIEKHKRMYLLHSRVTLEAQMYFEPGTVDTQTIARTKSAIVIKPPKGPYRNLALIPLQSENSDSIPEFTILGWNQPFEDVYIEAVVAIVLSTSWFFEMLCQTKKRKEMLLDTIQAITEAIDAKDPVTGGHSHRVSGIVREITRHLELDSQMQEDIYLGALIHDIGKIGVPDFILSKPGKLTAEEFKKMQDHPDIGHRIMQTVKLPVVTKLGMHEHHERYDGSGYPAGKSGDDISLAGRIIAVADVCDALLSERPYSRAMPLEEVCAFMDEHRGTDFDERIVDALLAIRNHEGSVAEVEAK